MSNPHDIIRNLILRELYSVHAKAKSPRSAGLRIRDLQKTLREKHGFKQQEVASNLDYLIQKGWVQEYVEARTFTTPKGTTQQAQRVSYKISAVGIDRLQGASTYERPELASRVNITNIHGVTVVGDGNVVNTNFTDLSRNLTDLRAAVLSSPTVPDEMKLEIAADIDTLQGQLQKPEPDRSIVKRAWHRIEQAVTAAGFVELCAKVAGFLGPLIN